MLVSDLPTIARRGVEAARAASTARMSSSRTSASEKVCCWSFSVSRSSVNFEGWNGMFPSG